MAKKMKPEHMGRIVTVHRMLHKEKYLGSIKWHDVKRIEPATGWLVGFRTVFNGTIVMGDYGNEFQQVKGIFCALVCFWPTYNPVHVPIDGYEIGGSFPRNPNKWTEADKKYYKDYCKECPQERDDKGRFKKYNGG